MAYTTYTGVNMVLQLETSTGNFVTCPRITEVRVWDQPEYVEFVGGTNKQRMHGQKDYRLEADMEVDDTNAATGNTYICAQVIERAEEARGLKFYPNGTDENRYFQLDALFFLNQLSTQSKNGAAMQMLRADEHVQASLSSGWQGIPSAST